MSMMNLLRNLIKSQNSTLLTDSTRSLPCLLRESPRHFSNEAAEQTQNSTVDSILRTPEAGLAYGRLTGITRHTLRSDIVNLLEGCNLTLQDVKVEYNRSFFDPIGMLLQFPSRSAFDAAVRTIIRNGRLYKLDRADRSQWDYVTPYDGKAVLLQGIPRNALLDDVERFLCGCEYDASSIQLLTRQAAPDPIRMAVVRFPSQTQAMNAVIMKNRSFCLNNQILVRILQ
ncbi:hypothetical protein RJ641_024830 [Dillenia turbinata]|uniref:RRM domain-containing protein n=1 Tax=Dillenia turbinata TaxID=194707 RepID=A0AAN8ZR53_9MAGN